VFCVNYQSNWEYPSGASLELRAGLGHLLHDWHQPPVTDSDQFVGASPHLGYSFSWYHQLLTRASSETADVLASGASVRKNVGVQVPLAHHEHCPWLFRREELRCLNMVKVRIWETSRDDY